MKNGSLHDRYVERIFDICINIIIESAIRLGKKSENAVLAANKVAENNIIGWCQPIHEQSENYILQNIEMLRHPNEMNVIFVNYLFIYTQTTSELPNPTNTNIVAFLINFLNDVVTGKIQCKIIYKLHFFKRLNKFFFRL